MRNLRDGRCLRDLRDGRALSDSREFGDRSTGSDPSDPRDSG
ncbi:hypothetical protein [Micromonospora chalcea]